MGYCPECEALIEEEFEDIGEILTCPECGVELEVASLNPLEFDLAPIEDEDDFDFDESDDEEDWGDDDFEDDDEDDDY